MHESVAAWCGSAAVLAFGDQGFTLVPRVAEGFVIGMRQFSASAERDAGGNAFFLQGWAEQDGVAALICDQDFNGRQSVRNETSAFAIARPALGETYDDRAALALADGMQLGV